MNFSKTDMVIGAITVGAFASKGGLLGSPSKKSKNFILRMELVFNFEGTEQEALEKLENDLPNLQQNLDDSVSYAIVGSEVIPSSVLGETLPFNYLKVFIAFNFEGTKKEAKDKLKEDVDWLNDLMVDRHMVDMYTTGFTIMDAEVTKG